MRKIIYIILLAFTFSSCEKVIDVDLKNADPVVVVEGSLTNIEGGNFVSLSKTNSFYTSEKPERLEGADVVVIDESGIRYTLDEVASGYYNNKDFELLPSKNYKLEVNYNNEFFESYSNSPSAVKIDSVIIEPSEFGGPGSGGGKGNHDNDFYRITCYFNDPLNEINFYRLRLFSNNESLSGFFVMNDKFYNGNTIAYQFEGIDLYENDIVKVELLGIDENNFDYFYTLSRIMGQGQDVTPGNPPTNIQGNAIGVFGANTFDTKTVIFKEENVIE